MPADTRSTRKAKHNDGGKQKEKCYPSEEGSEKASGSKRFIRETLSKKSCSSSPSSTRKSGRLRNGNYQPPTPSPLRRFERARSISSSGKTDASMSLTNATHKSFKRMKSVNELVIEANHSDQHVKIKSNASSQGKKTPPPCCYRDLFKARTTTVKASGSANGGRVGPCTSGNSGGCGKKVTIADKDDLREEGRFGEDFAESTSKSDKGLVDNVLQEAASETPMQNNLELHPRKNPLNASIEESETCSKRQRMDVHLPETNLFQDTCASSIKEIEDKEKDFSLELLNLPSACDTNCTNFINNLCDYWSKGQNILVIDGQVQAAHIIYFILALQANVSRPFLVVVPSSSISKWEAEFSYVAPSINTVVYDGSRDVRRMIRTLKFYDGPTVMFTVLLSTLDIITEDLEYIKCIRWEAVIMDECLKSKASADLISVKELASGSMILLLVDQINENAIDYYNILSLLDHTSDSCDFEGGQVESDSIALLREKLSPFILCGPKPGPSRLVEYWVPVQMSNVQLELYSSSLLANSTALCSKSGPVGLLREILISTRKCCDHPYVVEEKLQTRLIQSALPEDILDIGVEASGKLYFLDTMLTKIKDQGKKVVILFKTLGGSGRHIIGDILDDYVRQRFGKDCYERVDAGGVSSRRQASISRFNKEGRFIFLLETRACSSSIKLSSVDAVIIYGSDWNPLNDLKALQKIRIESRFEVKVFRLYTLCSIEEKVLLLSKKSIFLESDLKGLGFSTSHMLLTWGASFLFKKLDELHDCPGDPKILPQCSFLKDIVQELLSVLQTHGTHMSTKCISSARHTDGGYSTDISLLGELYSQFKDEDQHRLLWTKLLEGRQTTWIYLSLSSQRNRKRVQHFGETSETNAHIDDTVKRQKKNGNTNVKPCSPGVIKDVKKKPVLGLPTISEKNGLELSPKSACSTASAQKISATSSPDKLCDEQEDLHQMLKPDMERLFQILNLKEDVQQKAEQFLVYIIANQGVIRESDQLQAFLISVCWVAASILKEKIDHVESLSLARELLNFNCKIDDAEFLFSNMQFCMKKFLQTEASNLQGFSKDLVAGTEGFKQSNGKQKLIHEGFDIGGRENKSKYLNKIFGLRLLWCESKAKLERSFKLESSVVRSLTSNEAVRIDKLKMLEANHRKKLEEFESEMGNCLNSMKAKHRDEREAEEKERICKMNERKSWEENASNLPTKAAVVVPAKSCSSSGYDLEEENSKEYTVGVHVPLFHVPEEPHTDAAEDSSSAEVAANYADCKMDINSNDGDLSKSKSAVQIDDEARLFGNVGEKALDSLGVQGWLQFAIACAAEEVQQIATCKNSPLSPENPTVQEVAEANEESTAVRMEQHDEASSSTLLESLNSSSAMNPSVAVPVSQIWNNSQPHTPDFSSLHDCTVGKTSCNIGPSYYTNNLSPQGTICSNITTTNSYTFDQEVKSVKEIQVRNKRISLSKEEISKHFNVPIVVAAQELKIALTSLKKRCRELGIQRWPHRKLRSLDTLINNVEAIGKIEDNGKRVKEVIEELANEKRLLEEKPNLLLQDQTKRLRQLHFKSTYYKKKSQHMVSVDGPGMLHLSFDDVQGGR